MIPLRVEELQTELRTLEQQHGTCVSNVASPSHGTFLKTISLDDLRSKQAFDELRQVSDIAKEVLSEVEGLDGTMISLGGESGSQAEKAI